MPSSLLCKNGEDLLKKTAGRIAEAAVALLTVCQNGERKIRGPAPEQDGDH